MWEAAEALLPVRNADAYTQGIMDLGATVCARTRPRCDACPVAADCIARITQRTGVLPSPRPRRVVPQRAVRVLVLERAGEILLERRPAVGIWGGLWSLPEVADRGRRRAALPQPLRRAGRAWRRTAGDRARVHALPPHDPAAAGRRAQLAAARGEPRACMADAVRCCHCGVARADPETDPHPLTLSVPARAAWGCRPRAYRRAAAPRRDARHEMRRSPGSVRRCGLPPAAS